MNRGHARRFPLFWAGRATSQFGDQVSLLALPWLLAEETASPLVVGSLEMLAFLPMLLFGLPIGALADRRSRRRSMIQADLLRCMLLTSIPLAIVVLGFEVSVAHVLIVAFLAGACHALFEASAQAFLTDLVPSDGLVRANARLSLTEGLAEVFGPACAGLLIAVLGASGAIAIDGLTFALSALAIFALVRVRERVADEAVTVKSAIREGLKVMTDSPHLRSLTLVIGVSNLGSGVVAGLIVLFLQKDLSLSGWEAGLTYSANGAGGIAASLVSQRLATRVGIARTIPLALVIAASGFWLVAVTMQGSWFLTAPLGMTLIGLGVVTSFIASASLRQRSVETALLGRITTSYRTVVNGSVALGALLGGIVGEVAGIRSALVAGASIYAAVAVASFMTVLQGPDPAPLSGSSSDSD